MMKIVEINTAFRIFVGRIPKHASNKDLDEYFSQFGPIKNATVKRDKNTKLSRGFGFINCQDE